MKSLLVLLVALSVSTVFAGLSGLHVYWTCGGHRGLKAAIPKIDEKPLFRPGFGGTLVVAFLLAVAGTLVLERAAVGPGIVPPVVSLWGAWGVGRGCDDDRSRGR
jgi:hypothetical protein